jgi:hypothetical protein
MNLQTLRKTVNTLKSNKDLLLLQKQQKQLSVDIKKEQLEYLIQAKYVLSAVSLLTQKQFTDYISQTVTYVLQSIYCNRDLKFIVDFKIDRGKSSCHLMVQEGSKDPYEPESQSGGGVLDVISFALRIVMWSLSEPRTINTLWLDEPMKFLGEEGNLLQRAVAVMKELSERLPMQMILTTHIPILAEMADKSWVLTHDGTKCNVKELNAVGSVESVDKQVIPSVEEPEPVGLLRRRGK